MSERIPLLILGLGNVLLQDDGTGPAAIAVLLERYEAPEGTRVLDGGTLGLSLLPHLTSADAVILVDAVNADETPGTCVRVDGDDVPPAVAMRLSPHQVGVADLLDGARWLGRFPERLALLGIVPESIELGVGLSPPVRAQLPRLVAQVVRTAAEFGFDLRPRLAHEPEIHAGPTDVARLVAMS